MNNHIDARIAAIAEAIKRKAMEEEATVDELSRSLYEMARELRGLDGTGLDSAFSGQDILNREQFDKFVLNYSNFN